MMGGGDVKMLGALALWLPPLAVLNAGDHVARGRRADAGHAGPAQARASAGALEIPYGVAIAIAGFWLISEPIS